MIQRHPEPHVLFCERPISSIMATPSGDISVASASGIPSQSEQYDEVTQSLPPSHILADGRFVHLPPPTRKERIQFFERSIARHGLLQEDIENKKQSNEQDKKEDEEKKKEKQKIHPLALASARLQADGINELNRAINLSTLVATGEYFGLSNIVDPSLEISTTSATDSKGEGGKPSESTASAPTAASASSAAAPASESALELQDEQRIKASFVVKRKRFQFETASAVLSRHCRRLQDAIVAQARPDQRLLELRSKQSWRLVAPEHGTRALPHAARPTEIVACDVDLYHSQHQQPSSSGATSQATEIHAVLGRIAKRVPRYATMELREDYVVDNDLKIWKERHFNESPNRDNVQMDIDQEQTDNKDQTDREKKKPKAEIGIDENNEVWTRAEPFAIADPTLGKLDADFDPKKVSMLSLRFDIEKASTGFLQSAVLQPISGASTDTSAAALPQDETVLSALQHSLFCAKLFESIRRELAPDTEDVGHIRITANKTQSVVWLAGCEAETNFLPPPHQLSGDPHHSNGLALLSVIHCHEGEVKVQLDCEYTLTVKLVEAGQQHRNEKNSTQNVSFSSQSNGSQMSESRALQQQGRDSGSQTPAQLMLLCRALLLHAQERYHEHSMLAAEKLRQQVEADKNNLKGYMRKKEVISSPQILQSCVSLGSKMLFERRIRQRLITISEWVKSISSQNGADEGAASNQLYVEWLSLSVFDLHSQFTVTFRTTVVDFYMVCEELTVTSITDNGDYRKVKLHSDTEFELFLKLLIRRILRESKQ